MRIKKHNFKRKRNRIGVIQKKNEFDKKEKKKEKKPKKEKTDG